MDFQRFTNILASGPESELIFVIFTNCEQSTCLREEESLFVTTCHGYDVLCEVVNETWFVDYFGLVEYSQLAVLVVSPSPALSIIEDDSRVKLSRLYDFGLTDLSVEIGGDVDRYIGVSSFFISQLSVVIPTPTENIFAVIRNS